MGRILEVNSPFRSRENFIQIQSSSAANSRYKSRRGKNHMRKKEDEQEKEEKEKASGKAGIYNTERNYAAQKRRNRSAAKK